VLQRTASRYEAPQICNKISMCSLCSQICVPVLVQCLHSHKFHFYFLRFSLVRIVNVLFGFRNFGDSNWTKLRVSEDQSLALGTYLC
jgi:hypothetical protein